ncbi:hypothetical protein PsorP6_007800 [Peronosclerospora sorghi]|uniref:Uncharacterized protein n=1 Tax=Peronosclerospora sorghi TaxID=230839 RepID=A0ACC0W6S6_9STRA|nr:hypothetical protein PsorP6_007800 [Peronosclerospora sorghi]
MTRASATTSSSSRGGGDQEATPSRHPNEDILPEVADENDDLDGSRSQPAPPSKSRRVSKAANNDISRAILEMETQRQNCELGLERMRAKERMEREARQKSVEERRRQEAKLTVEERRQRYKKDFWLRAAVLLAPMFHTKKRLVEDLK